MILLLWIFLLGNGDIWTSVNGEFEDWMVSNHLFPETVKGTCAHLMETGNLVLHFFTSVKNDNNIRVVIYCHIYMQQIGCILRCRFHRLQSSQPITKHKNFYFSLLSRGFDPRTFQFWVLCLAIWAITPNGSFIAYSF